MHSEFMVGDTSIRVSECIDLHRKYKKQKSKYPLKKMFWCWIANKGLGPLLAIAGMMNLQSDKFITSSQRSITAIENVSRTQW